MHMHEEGYQLQPQPQRPFCVGILVFLLPPVDLASNQNRVYLGNLHTIQQCGYIPQMRRVLQTRPKSPRPWRPLVATHT